jgi:cell wall-associated NlpC family hydrolase
MTPHMQLNALGFQSGLAGGSPSAITSRGIGTYWGPNGGGAQFVGTSMNPSDAVQQLAVMQQTTGTFGTMGQQTQQTKGAVGMTGFLNPALSGTQAAQAVQQQYMPQTSLNMRMLGYPSWGTPRKPGGGQNTLPNQALGFLAANTRGGRVSPKWLGQQLIPGGILNTDMLAAGMNPQTMGPVVEATNALFSGTNANTGKTGLPRQSSQQINSLFSQIQYGGRAQRDQAEGTLAKYGIKSSDLQQLKQNQGGTAAANLTATQQGFDAGLKTASNYLADFNTKLHQLLGSPFWNMIGQGQGFSSTVKGFGNPQTGASVLGIGSSALGLLGLKRLLMGGGASRGISGLLRGAGGAGAGGAAADTGLAAGAGVGTAGLALGGLAAEYGINKGISKLPSGGPWGRVHDLARGAQEAFNPLGGFHGMSAGVHDIWHGLFGGGSPPNAQGGGATSPSGSSMLSGPVDSSGKPIPPHKRKAPPTSTINPKALKAAKVAQTQVGVPYAYGKEAPGKGFDCSGIIQWAYQQAGIHLPRTAMEQMTSLSKDAVGLDEVQTGDLVFQPGPGTSAHEAMLVSPRQIVEAKGVGTKIAVRDYIPSEWRKAARPWGLAKSTSKNRPATGANRANVVGGGVSAAQDLAALSFMESQIGHPYLAQNPQRFGPVDWDCSGLLWAAFHHAGVAMPGGPSSPAAAIVDPELVWLSQQPGATVIKQQSQIKRGDVVGMHGASPSGSSPWGPMGHIGMAESSTEMVSALGTATGVTKSSIGGFVVGIRPEGGGGAPASGSSAGTSAAAAPARPPYGLNTQGLNASGIGGMGDQTGEGSTPETQAFLGAITGGAHGGSGYYGEYHRGPRASASSSGTSGPAGNAVAGSAMQNAISIGKGLVAAGYSKIGAAGVVACIYGEAGPSYNPEVKGSGGAGLIGWTPPSTMAQYGATIGGNPSTDLNNQIKGIIAYDAKNGNVAALNSQSSVTAAADYYSINFERPAVRLSDVHAGGIATATAAMASFAEGGTILVGERGPEILHVGGSNKANIYNSAQSAQLLENAVKPAQAPYASGPGASWNYSQAHNAYQGGSQGSKGMSFHFGDIVIQGGSSGPVSNPQNQAQQFVKEVQKAMTRIQLHNQIASGVNS